MSEKENNNLDVEKSFINYNIKFLELTPKKIPFSYSKYKSKRTNKLIDKTFIKLDKQVKNNILNSLNTKNTTEIENLLSKYIKTDSITSNLMRIYRTENTIVRSKLKIDIQQELKNQGIIVRRQWLHAIYNPAISLPNNYTPRLDHIDMSGQTEDDTGYFHNINGNKTKAPSMFGIPSEDINCRCDVIFVK